MNHTLQFLAITFLFVLFSCKPSSNGDAATTTTTSDISAATDGVGQSKVKDDVSNPNIVQVAINSKDHTTLVTAVKAGGLVDALSNAGPFTVFAPINGAFDKLPAGTVDNLLKPENKADLVNILEYHTYVGALKPEYFKDGQSYEEVNGKKVNITVKDSKIFVNGSEILASINTSNGWIHVIGDVLIPQ
ncbi:MAG: fasciclin domain-containing protein [Saprospiraceae bacterium]